MFSEMNWATSSGSSVPRSRAFRLTMAMRVSKQGGSISVTMPHLKRDTSRSWSVGMSFGGLSDERTICFPAL